MRSSARESVPASVAAGKPEATATPTAGFLQAPAAAGAGLLQPVLWSAALLFAFLPVLVDLVRHLVMSPWARYAAVFPLLFVRAALHERQRGVEPSGRGGTLWILAGLAFEALTIFLGATRMGRFGALLAAIGLCRRFGWGSWRSVWLLLFALPVPTALVKLAQPISVQLQALADALVGGAGAEVAALSLGRYGSGMPMAVLMMGLGWYAALLRGLPIRQSVTLAVGLFVCALPLQLLGLVLAALAVPRLGSDTARAALLQGLPLATATVGVLLAELGARRERSA
jgi:hypothetical protein